LKSITTELENMTVFALLGISIPEVDLEELRAVLEKHGVAHDHPAFEANQTFDCLEINGFRFGTLACIADEIPVTRTPKPKKKVPDPGGLQVLFAVNDSTLLWVDSLGRVVWQNEDFYEDGIYASSPSVALMRLCGPHPGRKNGWFKAYTLDAVCGQVLADTLDLTPLPFRCDAFGGMWEGEHMVVEDTIGSNEEKPKTVVFASSLESALRSVARIPTLKPKGFASEIRELVDALSTHKLKVHPDNVARPWDAWQRLRDELAAYENRSEMLRDVHSRGPKPADREHTDPLLRMALVDAQPDDVEWALYDASPLPRAAAVSHLSAQAFERWMVTQDLEALELEVLEQVIRSVPSSSAHVKLLLNMALKNPNPWIRRAVVLHESLPAQDLGVLASDPEPCVRAEVARHARCTEFPHLIHDAHPRVIESLARNPAGPLEQVVSWKTAWILVENPNTPREVLERLTHLPSLENAVQMHTDRHTNSRLPPRPPRELQAADPSIPSWRLKLLARPFELRDVRIAAIRNPGFPPDALEHAEDPDDLIRYAVASNPWTPLEILQSLATDSYIYVLAAVASHPNSSDELLMAIDYSNDIVARALAGNPRTPEPLLQKLAQTKDVWRIRELILNPNVSDSLISELQIPAHPHLELALKWRGVGNSSSLGR